MLEELEAENVDQYILNALSKNTDKTQKGLVKQLYQERELVCDNCSAIIAIKTISSSSFLSFIEGRKLVAHLLVEILKCSDFWNTIKRHSVSRNIESKMFQFWGEIILHAWKNAPEVEAQKNRETSKTRAEIETEIIENAFYCAILTKPMLSKKFNWLIDQFLEENLTKKMNAMFFRCLLPNLWRNLEAVNEDVRIAASMILLKFYPLRSDDDTIDIEYLEKQQYAMEHMLMDDCVPIRIEAIKKLLLHLSTNWEDFPRILIKNCLKKIVDQLSYDSVADVRVAVYEGFVPLLGSGNALNANEHSLRILAKRGPNDKMEKVRLAAFKLLNELHGHRYIKVLDLIDVNDTVYRLDFEHSTAVQTQIVKLIFKAFCPTHVEGIDYIVRFQRIYVMCKISRNASLHFHRIIYSDKARLISLKGAVHHIRSLLLGVKMALKKQSGSGDASCDETTDLLNCTGVSSTTSMNEPIDDEKMKVLKSVLDSAIVLWLNIRGDLYETGNANENSLVISMMANILQALENYHNTHLMDSALVIARNLPKDKVGRLFTNVKQKLEKDEINNAYFNHYIEAFAFWDANKLIDMIEKGLKKLRNAVIEASDPHQLTATPRRRIPDAKIRMRDSPPPKKGKMTLEEEYRRPLEFIKMLLASPHSSDFLKSKFDVHLASFFENLSIIRRQFGQLMFIDEWEKKFDRETLMIAYETLTIVTLITKKIEVPRRNSRGEEPTISEAELELPVNDRILYNELKWFASILNEMTPPYPIIEMFLRCMNLHLDCGELTAPVLDQVGTMLIEIKNRIVDAYNVGQVEVMLKKSIRHLEQSLEFCSDQDAAQGILEDRVQEILNYLSAADGEDFYDDD